jgi:hypothetical protein
MAVNEVALPRLAAAEPAPGDDAAGAAPELRTLALAALAQHMSGTGADAPEAQFLAEHARATGPAADAWVRGVAPALRAPHAADAALVRLSGELGLEPIEVLTAALAAAVEQDVMVGRAIAHLQAPLGGSRPMLSLITSTFAALAPPGRAPLDAIVGGNAIRGGLLVLHDDAAPLPERAVSVPLHLCRAFAGDDGELAGMTIGPGEDATVPLPPSMLSEALRHASALCAAPHRLLVLRTGGEGEGRAVADAIARAMSRRPLFIEGETRAGVGPWCSARQLLPVFVVDVGPGERKRIAALAGYDGPMLALTGPDGSIDSAAGAAPAWRLPVPPIHERRRLWLDAVGDEGAAGDLARHHRHGAGRIAQLTRLAAHRAALAGRERIAPADVVVVSRAGEGAGLDALAQLVPDAIGDDALVLSATVSLELEALLLRCRARDGLTDDLGASAASRYTPGVRALFVGPSGTGKTLAAAWLATRLGLPLFRVDLASITSKYIGETEKNLAQLLARAEQSEVVLLFDEADSLFGKRTDIKEANDRFANAQTNYLLQRIESFDGIALLTSNSRARFDPAFGRRLDAIIDFPMPGPEERRNLWRSHLGDAHALTAGDLNRLAAAAHLSGGNIRNVVLLAAVLARSDSRPIAYADVLRGLLAEYRKLGKQMPVELKG